ncbi:Vgb family protein [Methylobacter sp.]|uniref:Vgb family protein n=1 Tax=Methylobacter sp. TaxID=2051955 RepID=UPI003DA641DF
MKLNSVRRMSTLTLLLMVCIAAHGETTNKFASPESVLFDQSHFYVSNVGEKLNPTAEDGDGYISLVDTKGNIIEQKYFDIPLNAPKGMAIDNNILYVADINRVVGLDVKTRQKILEVSLKDQNVSFLNDIAIDKNGILYVSATDTGEIYQINPRLTADEAPASRLPIKKIPGPNGLVYDAQTHSLWIASFGSGNAQKGELGKLDVASLHYEKVTDVSGMLDGIAIKDNNTVLVSDWVAFDNSGRIIEIDLATGTQKVLANQIGGPADFVYISESKQLVIPRMIESRISFQSLN